MKTDVRLPSGQRVRLYGLHPAPPAPQYSETTSQRDAELILVGREAKLYDKPVVVVGDLNDVAWSHTTRLFRRISGLLDPRIGRRTMSTFPLPHPYCGSRSTTSSPPTTSNWSTSSASRISARTIFLSEAKLQLDATAPGGAAGTTTGEERS
ncbi:MAG: endonuclease/exonuclease/phosphatase family protein [Bryobacterales bacterium]